MAIGQGATPETDPCLTAFRRNPPRQHRDLRRPAFRTGKRRIRAVVVHSGRGRLLRRHQEISTQRRATQGLLTTHHAAQRCCCCLVAELCLALFDPTDCSTPGSPAHGISQARKLEWVTISFSRDLHDLGIKPTSPAPTGTFFAPETQVKPEHTPLSYTLVFPVGDWRECSFHSLGQRAPSLWMQLGLLLSGEKLLLFYCFFFFFESMKTLFQSSKFYLKVF